MLSGNTQKNKCFCWYNKNTVITEKMQYHTVRTEKKIATFLVAINLENS